MDDVTIRPAASRATKVAPTDWFTGTVLQDALATPLGTSRTSATLVTFSPGARTNWHTHKTRQVLVATHGTGMVEVRNRPPRVMRAGDVVALTVGTFHDLVNTGTEPLRVIAFNAVEGWSRDVSEEIAYDVLDRAYDADTTLSQGAKRFIDRHLTPGMKRPPAPSVLGQPDQASRKKA